MFCKKISLSNQYIRRIINELLLDLITYYWNPYPLLLILGAFKRIKRRLKILWLPKSKGRPTIDEKIINLILDMKRTNWLWGALRISQELGLLGISIHKKTVARILKEFGLIPPKVRFYPPSWKALMTSYKDIWQVDFTCVMDIFDFQIFILVILDHKTRELVFMNVTLHPTREWLLQQIRNVLFDLDPPEAMIIDHDGIYGKWLVPISKKYFGITVFQIPYKKPWMNGRVERFHQSLKIELLNRIVITIFEQVQRFCFEYRKYYNKYRPHQSLNGKTPDGKNGNDQKVFNFSGYQKISEVNGLITRFEIAA